MKNLFKFTLVLLVFAGLSNTASAQTVFTANDITVTANVAVPITFAETNIQLGTIISDVATYIQANGFDPTSSANLGATNNAGQIVISGTPSQSVTVNYTNASLTLAGDGSTNTTAFTTTVLLDGTATVVGNGSTQALDGSGDLTLDIGGGLASIAAANAGVYTTAGGQGIIFTLTYN